MFPPDDGNSNQEMFYDEASHIQHTQEEFDEDPEKEKQRMLDMINKLVEK